MKIDVIAVGSRVPTAERDGVEQRLRLALSRFGQSVDRVTVELCDLANPLGGVDTRCRMQAWLRPGGHVQVETLDGSGAVDRAAERLAARVEWALLNGQASLASARIPLASPSSGRTPSLHPQPRTRRKPAVGPKRSPK